MKTTSVTVDSISEGIAVLDTPAGAVRIPVALLPEGTVEGTRLTLALSLDPTKTAQAREDIRTLRESMTKGRPDPGITEI